MNQSINIYLNNWANKRACVASLFIRLNILPIFELYGDHLGVIMLKYDRNSFFPAQSQAVLQGIQKSTITTRETLKFTFP